MGFMVAVDSAGTGAFLAVSAIFLTRSVGLSVAQVGLGLSLGAAVGLVSTIPIGALADRYGPRRVLVTVSLWRAAGFVAYPFVGGFVPFVVVVCLLGLVDKVAAPMEQALVGQAVPEDQRVHTMAVMRALRNVGFTGGALLGSVALVLDKWPAYAFVLFANAASFVALAILAARLPGRPGPGVASVRRRVSFQVLADRPFLALAGLNALLTLHMPLLSVGIPVWIAEHSHAPRAVIAPLLAVNTVLVVALQVRASHGSGTSAGAARRLRQAGLALAVCCLLLAVLPHLSEVPAIALLVAAMVALTGGELFQSAGGWGLSYALARPGQEGAYLSMFWLGVAVQQIAAPVLLATVVQVGAVGWIALAAIVTAAGLAAPLAARRAVRSRLGTSVTSSLPLPPAASTSAQPDRSDAAPCQTRRAGRSSS
jgi:hypothetical protein